MTERRVLDAALAIVDEHGLDALSMRRLGATLGVDPMAVYHHVPGKRALLRRLAESVFDTMPVPDPGGDWRTRVRAWAVAYRSVALAHPGLALHALSDAPVAMAAAVRANEPLFAALVDAGLAPAHVLAAATLAVDYLNGSMLALVARADASDEADRDDAEPPATSLAEELARHPSNAFPVQRRVLVAAAEPRVDDVDPALDVILAGIEALAVATRG